MTRPRRIFFYVQHLLGIGHLARASRIADALAEAGMDVTMVTGGAPVPGFPSARVRHVELPAIMAGDAGFSDLVDASGRPIDDAFKADRARRLLAAFDDARPDAVIIEQFPFGRRQVRFELLPLLDHIAGMSERPRLYVSLRDILQERSKPGRDEETVAAVERYFDAVLVHGDPGFVRLEETFPLAARILDKVTYTGLVAPPPPVPADEHFDVVVSAGGGVVGRELIAAALDAATRLGGTWCVITGPNLPQADFDQLAARGIPGVRLERFRPNLAGLMAASRVSVSQAGYNTVCDVLRARCRAVLVPFAAGGETEQSLRASRLADLGLAEVIAEADLGGDRLAAAVSRALDAPAPPAARLDLEGASATARLLAEL